MFIVQPYPEDATRYVVIHRFGGPREWLTIEEFIYRYTLDFIRDQVAYHFDSPIKVIDQRRGGLHYDRLTSKCVWDVPEISHDEPCEWIIRDTYGNRLTAKEMEPRYYEEYRARRWRCRKNRQGRKTDHLWGSWRSMKTNNERKAAYVNVDDGEPTIRGARNHNNIPNAWACESRHAVQKNWKRQSKRKHQWRPLKA